MTRSETRRLRRLRVAGGILFSAYRAILYFLSFVGPVLVLVHFRWLPAALLLALSIVGFGGSGVIFLFLLVLTKRLLIGPVRATGVGTIHNEDGKRWFLAAMLTVILDHSPFRSMVSGLSLVASWYFRGMGARMPNSVMLGSRTLIFDPWFLEVGENVNIGAGAVILGHLGHGKEFILGGVVIGDGAVIGMQAVVFPDVCIGSHATVAAGAVVVRGTVIPDGEVWAGVPARRIARGSAQDSLTA